MLKVIKQIHYEGNNIIECGIYKGDIQGSLVNIYVNGKWFDIDFDSIEIRNKYIKKSHS